MKYIDLIKLGEQAIDALKAPFIENKNRLKLETEINDLESKIADAAVAIQNQKMSKEVDWKKVGSAIDEKELLERRLSQFKKLKEELF